MAMPVADRRGWGLGAERKAPEWWNPGRAARSITAATIAEIAAVWNISAPNQRPPSAFFSWSTRRGCRKYPSGKPKFLTTDKQIAPRRRTEVPPKSYRSPTENPPRSNQGPIKVRPRSNPDPTGSHRNEPGPTEQVDDSGFRFGARERWCGPLSGTRRDRRGPGGQGVGQPSQRTRRSGPSGGLHPDLGARSGPTDPR